ncbi:MAG: hypothetical protein H0X30_34420 [Anaerolineae bacterium]|nr:hypothetical protein [Anaerolineae bacterium]
MGSARFLFNPVHINPAKSAQNAQVVQILHISRRNVWRVARLMPLNWHFVSAGSSAVAASAADRSANAAAAKLAVSLWRL